MKFRLLKYFRTKYAASSWFIWICHCELRKFQSRKNVFSNSVQMNHDGIYMASSAYTLTHLKRARSVRDFYFLISSASSTIKKKSNESCDLFGVCAYDDILYALSHIQISFSLDSHNLASGRMLHDYSKAAGWLLHGKCFELFMGIENALPTNNIFYYPSFSIVNDQQPFTILWS